MKDSSIAGHRWSGKQAACALLLSCLTCVALALPGTSAAATLTVTRQGTGSGLVTSAPAGISCGTTCSASFSRNVTVTLTVTPASGSTFTGWSGSCAGSATTAKLVMKSRNLSCGANFAVTAVAPTTYTLTVARAGAGAGTVNSAPTGIACGSACSAAFSQGTPVSLTASPAAGSVFTTWSGLCAGTGATTSITLNASSTCTATFDLVPPPQLSLTVSRNGTGAGTVASTPAGITCGTICTSLYSQGTAVTLTATAAAGSTFTGWTGDCIGTSATTSITVNASASCGASFTQVPLTTGTADLSWDAVSSPGLAGYRVYFGTSPGVYFQALGQGLDAGTLTAVAMGGFTSGMRYYFAGTAYDAANAESAFSNEVFKDMP